MWRPVLLAALAAAAQGQDLPRGQIVDPVKCAADASQSYALYLPSNYSPGRNWAVIFAFDAGGRGRRGVERYQAAAEKYGYILAGSNNSRNGPWEVSLNAAQAMSADVRKRFSINPKRMYTAGMSGGARVAMKIALDSGQFAGVFASSAGYPDAEPRKSVPFAVFGTAGTEDFNNLEMRQLDHELTSPHQVAIFQGGHAWLPPELAMQAVEWMEVQGMKSGRRDRDEALLTRIFDTRVAQADALKDPAEKWLALVQIGSDFQGLKDVKALTARAKLLQREKSVTDALAKQRAEEQSEAKTGSELARLESGLSGENEQRRSSLAALKARLTAISRQANAPQDSTERRMARRVISGILTGSRGIDDADYQALLQNVRPQNVRIDP